jgi:hypothetical protein
MTWGLVFSPMFTATLVDGPDSEPQATPLLSPETIVAAGPSLAAGTVSATITGFRIATATNTVPRILARVIPGRISPSVLGVTDAVFVTAADDIAGLNARELGKRLGIKDSEYYTVIEFSAPAQGIASPVLRDNPLFIGKGFTAGGAREFVIPNGPIPLGASIRIVGP